MMYRRTLTVLIVVFWFWPCAAPGQCPVDPLDSILCVYKVDRYVGSAQFSATDGQVSEFFSDSAWAGRDYIRLKPPQNCYPGRCSMSDTNDATVTIRATATTDALFMYVDVRDDVWVPWAGGDNCGEDPVVLYFDALAAEELWSCTDCLLGNHSTAFASTALSYTTLQYEFFMGGSSVQAELVCQYYDDNLWSWRPSLLTWANARNRYGIEGEIIHVDSTRRTFEGYFPWDTFGKGIPLCTPLGGKHYAFSVGYNDKDGDNPEPDCLRWLGKDPWVNDQNYWGNLHLDDQLGLTPCIWAVREERSRMVRATDGPRTWYTLTGKQANPGTGGASILIECSALRQDMQVVRRVVVRPHTAHNNSTAQR